MALLPFDRTCHMLSYRVIVGNKYKRSQKQKLSAPFIDKMMQILIIKKLIFPNCSLDL